MRRDPESGCARITTNIFLVAGLLLVPFALAVDYLLPNASPGISYVQLLIMAAGLALALIAWQFKRPELQRKLTRSCGKSIAAGLIVTLLTLVAIEISLGAFGMVTYFPPSAPEARGAWTNWRICDEPGCHFDQIETQLACSNGILSGRFCKLNRQGYSDSRNFVPPSRYGDELRLLALGDSFTFGMTADPGKSYIEFLESRFPEIEIWNAGFPGTATNQAVESFNWYAPRLRPQLTTLGFHTNDFLENLLPIDHRSFMLTPDGKTPVVSKYYLDYWGNAFAYEPQDVLRYYKYRNGPPRNSIEYWLGITRLGTLALRVRDAVGPLVGGLHDRSIQMTREYLRELKDQTRAQHSGLLVLVIPARNDLESPSELYFAGLRALEELGIHYLTTAHLLDATADYAMPPDGHWNTAGHQKVGAFLSECIAVFIESGDLSLCDSVVFSGDKP